MNPNLRNHEILNRILDNFLLINSLKAYLTYLNVQKEV